MDRPFAGSHGTYIRYLTDKSPVEEWISMVNQASDHILEEVIEMDRHRVLAYRISR